MSCEHSNYESCLSDGQEVCTGCGLVLGPIYVYNTNFGSSYLEEEQPTELHQVVDRFSIPGPIAAEANNAFQHLPFNLVKRNRQVAMAYAMYQAFSLHKVRRSRNEVCRMFNVSTKEFNTFQSRCHISEPKVDLVKPSDLLPRVDFRDKVSYETMQLWARLADNLYTQVSSTPASVLAFVVYKHLRHRKPQTRPRKIVTMADIAKICNVSPTSIKRLNRSFRSFNPNTQLQTLVPKTTITPNQDE